MLVMRSPLVLVLPRSVDHRLTANHGGPLRPCHGHIKTKSPHAFVSTDTAGTSYILCPPCLLYSYLAGRMVEQNLLAEIFVLKLGSDLAFCQHHNAIGDLQNLGELGRDKNNADALPG